MKKLIAIFVLLALAGGGTWYYYNYGQKKEKPTVMTAAVSRSDITEAVQATGSLEALRTVQVGSQVSGTVKDLFGIDFNSIVKKNQKIGQLDDSLLKVQVEIQKANMERQGGDIEQSLVQLENDKLNLQRTQAQFDAKLVSKQALETAQLAVKSREASIASARKTVIQTQAALNQAQLNVDYCTIYSPIDGVVVERKVDIGQTVQSSVNVAQFYTIATDLTSLKLTAMVDEAEIGKVRRGMPVMFKVDAYGTQDFQGTVDAVRLNATNNQNVVTYPVWITVPNNDLKLKPSMTASIRIIISTAESALRIPNAALRFKPTSDQYTALGLTPPQAGGGRNMAGGPAGAAGGNTRGQGGGGANANGTAEQPPAPGAPTTPPPAADAKPGPPTGQPGQQAQNTSGRGGQSGRGGAGGTRTPGFGNGTQMTQQGMADFANRTRGAGGRGGGGRTGAQAGGGGRGGRPQTPGNAAGNATPLTQRTQSDGSKAEKIDDLFPDLPKIVQRGTVYTWDEAKKELKGISVSYGVTDGQFSELISGNDIQQGTNLVTSVIVPQTTKPGQPNNANPFMGQQPGRGMGGMTPGGGGPGGGGGGGGRGGGGGGGRGGN